jgi:hypothetical protein
VLYLERPAQRREFALPHGGRFGYSDLKEAAHGEAMYFEWGRASQVGV